jgi:hypothetical protein
MLAFLLSLSLAVAPCYADGHNRHRNHAALRAFKRAHPCPGGPDRGSTGRCKGYVVDHVCALECCGLDQPQNMQWQTRAESKRKDRWEGNCSNCGPAGR